MVETLSPQNKKKLATTERPYCTHRVPLRLTLMAPSDFLMLAVPLITYQLYRLLLQYHFLKNSVIFAAVKGFISKLICHESSQNRGHRRHDFQL